MGAVCCMAPPDPQKVLADRLERQIVENKKFQLKRVKILMLGTQGAGKSTLKRQFELLYGPGFGAEERKAARDALWSGAIKEMKLLVEMRYERIDVDFNDNGSEKSMSDAVVGSRDVSTLLAERARGESLEDFLGIKEAGARMAELTGGTSPSAVSGPNLSSPLEEMPNEPPPRYGPVEKKIEPYFQYLLYRVKDNQRLCDNIIVPVEVLQPPSSTGSGGMVSHKFNALVGDGNPSLEGVPAPKQMSSGEMSMNGDVPFEALNGQNPFPPLPNQINRLLLAKQRSNSNDVAGLVGSAFDLDRRRRRSNQEDDFNKTKVRGKRSGSKNSVDSSSDGANLSREASMNENSAVVDPNATTPRSPDNAFPIVGMRHNFGSAALETIVHDQVMFSANEELLGIADKPIVKHSSAAVAAAIDTPDEYPPPVMGSPEGKTPLLMDITLGNVDDLTHARGSNVRKNSPQHFDKPEEEAAYFLDRRNRRSSQISKSGTTSRSRRRSVTESDAPPRSSGFPTQSTIPPSNVSTYSSEPTTTKFGEAGGGRNASVMWRNMTVAQLLEIVWHDPRIQRLYHETWSLFPPSLAHVMNDLTRSSVEDFHPTNEDVLIANKKTFAVDIMEFEACAKKFFLVDVGGGRTDRDQWLAHFDYVDAIVFVVNLDQYDQVMPEDGHTNRLRDSLVLFEELCRSPWFHKTKFNLVLNKVDVFRTKIATTPLSVCFKSTMSGNPNDYDFCVAYIIKRFATLHNHYSGISRDGERTTPRYRSSNLVSLLREANSNAGGLTWSTKNDSGSTSSSRFSNKPSSSYVRSSRIHLINSEIESSGGGVQPINDLLEVFIVKATDSNSLRDFFEVITQTKKVKREA